MKLYPSLVTICIMIRAGVNSKRIDQFNYNSIPELKREFEFKVFELFYWNQKWFLLSNLNLKILTWIGIEWKGIEHLIFHRKLGVLQCSQVVIIDGIETHWTGIEYKELQWIGIKRMELVPALSQHIHYYYYYRQCQPHLSTPPHSN